MRRTEGSWSTPPSSRCLVIPRRRPLERNDRFREDGKRMVESA